MIRRLLRESATYGLAGAASRFVGILLVPLYTRIFRPDEYGLLDVLVTTSTILVLISGMQVESGVGRSYYEAKEQGSQQTLVGTGLLLYVIGVVPCVLLCILGFQWLGNGYRGVTWVHVAPLLLTLFPSQVVGYTLVILRLERRPWLFLMFSIGDIFVSALLSILMVVGLGWGIPGVLWSLFLSKLLWAVIATRVLGRQYRLFWSAHYAREVLTYSVPTVPTTLVSWAQNYANRFILVVALTMFDVGIFSLAVKIASAAAVVITAFRLSWYPYAIELMGKPGSAEKYARMLDYYCIGVFSMCAFTGAVGGAVVRVLAPETYVSAGRLVGFIAIGLLWNGALEIVSVGIDYVRKTYLGLIGLTLGAFANLFALWVTVQRWGLLAASFTYVLGSIITAVIILALSQNQYHIPYRYSVIAFVAVLSAVLPFWFYLAPGPVGPLGAIVLDTAVKLLVSAGICVGVSAVVVSQADKKRLLTVAASAWKRV